MLQIKRIPEYDKYLNELLDETDSSHPDFEDLTKAANRVKNVSFRQVVFTSFFQYNNFVVCRFLLLISEGARYTFLAFW